MNPDLLNEEDDDFRARMYGSDDDEGEGETAGPKTAAVDVKPTGIMNMVTLSHEVRRLTKTVEEQASTIKRLSDRVRRMERHAGKLSKAINEHDGELANKIDRRD